MKTIFTSTEHLLMHGPNQSFGNHMLHLYFVYKVALERNISFAISSDSNLDELLELSNFKKKYATNTICLFDESWGGNFEEFNKKELSNYDFVKKLLYDKNFILPNSFYLKGWFWHEESAPSKEIFDVLKIKKQYIDYVNEKYPQIFSHDTIVIHYRGTDFKNHSIGWGNLTLPMSYYKESIEAISKFIEIKNCVIVSDEPDYITKELNEYNFNFTITNEKFYIDWLILYLCKNVICSNSSFCWTACVFNKEYVIQPKGFFMHNIDKTKVFPPNIYYKNSIII